MTPPYLFITFALSSVLISFAAFRHDVSNANIKNAVVDVLAMIVPGTFAWLAGTLPLKPHRPSLNVAQLNDVRKLFLFIPVVFDKGKYRYRPLHCHVLKMMSTFGLGVLLRLSNRF